MILVEINFAKPLSVNVWLTVFAAFNGNWWQLPFRGVKTKIISRMPPLYNSVVSSLSSWKYRFQQQPQWGHSVILNFLSRFISLLHNCSPNDLVHSLKPQFFCYFYFRWYFSTVLPSHLLTLTNTFIFLFKKSLCKLFICYFTWYILLKPSLVIC